MSVKMLRNALLALLLLQTAGCTPERRSDDSARANLLWLVLDALRAENLSCYGYERQTSPNLDRLAARGVLFEQHYVQYFKTRGSVSRYLSGRLFPVPGFVGHWRHTWRRRPREEKYISEILRDNGYQTALLTSHGLFSAGSRIARSFDEVNPGASRLPENFGELNEMVRAWLLSRDDRPFFLYLHAMDTHFPHDPAPPYDRWIDPEHPRRELRGFGHEPPYSEADRQYLRGLYDGSILYADAQFGALLELLSSVGELERTVVVVSSDHGEALGEDSTTVGHGMGVTADENFHVPLIIAGPGIGGPRRVEVLTQSVDIVPTLIELLEAATVAKTDGSSLVPAVRNSLRGELHDYVYSGSLEDDGVIHILRNNEAKFVQRTRGWTEERDSVEELWKVPDTLADRLPLERGRQDKLTEMRAFLSRSILPLARATEELPLDEPQVFIAEVADAEGWGEGATGPTDRGQAGSRPSESNGRWALNRRSVLRCGLTEDCPEITLRFEVPNGIYRVALELVAGVRGDGGRGYGAAFLVKAQNEESFQRLLWQADGRGRRGFVAIGQYEVVDGVFAATLDDSGAGMLAAGGRFEFTPDTLRLESTRSESVERLRALGYLD